MRPKKKRAGREEQPDPVKDELPDTVGGTDGELGVDRDLEPPDAAADAGCGRPPELGGEDDELI